MSFFVLVFICIILHELGHYTAARCCGVSVRKFCICWDPGFHLLSTGKRFNTEFCLGWLPLGGYVVLRTDDGDSSLSAKPAWKRLVFYSAGLSVNLSLAYAATYLYTDHYLDPENHYSVTAKARFSAQCLEKRTITFYKTLWHTFDNNDQDESAMKETHHQQTSKHKAPSQQDNVVRHGLWRFSFINLMLFLFNILPIPPLDGGFICLQAYGIVSRRKIPKNIELAIVGVGALLVIAFLSYDYITGIIEWIHSLRVQ